MSGEGSGGSSLENNIASAQMVWEIAVEAAARETIARQRLDSLIAQREVLQQTQSILSAGELLILKIDAHSNHP